jgi:ABC-type Fe3+-hydroxamate transport system substrate-binding protein
LPPDPLVWYSNYPAGVAESLKTLANWLGRTDWGCQLVEFTTKRLSQARHTCIKTAT